MSSYILMLKGRCALAALNSLFVHQSHLRIWWLLRKTPMERRQAQICCWWSPGLSCCRWVDKILHGRVCVFSFAKLTSAYKTHLLGGGDQYSCLLQLHKDGHTVMLLASSVLCLVRIDCRNVCESALSFCRCRRRLKSKERKRMRSTSERERPGTEDAKSWRVISPGFRKSWTKL